MARRNQPYLPLYVQDFMTDEKLVECSAEATGVYIRIMCIMHKSQEYGTVLLKQKDKQDENSIKNFARKLHRLMPYSVEVIERALTELVEEEVLQLDGDVLSQKRMVSDAELSDTRARAGSKGGKKTQQSSQYGEVAQAKEEAAAKAKAQANTESESEIEIEDISIKRTRKRTSYDDPDFANFWDAYPKKQAKADALKAFEKLKPDNETLNLMLDAIAKWRATQQWTKEGGQFIPLPATWLNGRRWEDALPAPQEPEPRERTFEMLN